MKPMKVSSILLLTVLLSSILSKGLYLAAASQRSSIPTAYVPESPHTVNTATKTLPHSASSELLASSTVSSSAGNWHIECADCPKWIADMTDRGLQVDSKDQPHIAYGGDHLYYAWYDQTQWHYETVDESSSTGK